jgi:hypothetical protein
VRFAQAKLEVVGAVKNTKTPKATLTTFANALDHEFILPMWQGK